MKKFFALIALLSASLAFSAPTTPVSNLKPLGTLDLSSVTTSTGGAVANTVTANQKAAVAGTSGTAVSATNKLVDNADTRMTNARTATMANPSGTIGLTASNGSASTAMRSDGTPALGVGITPHWTAQHIFDKAPAIPPTNLSGGTALAVGTYYYDALTTARTLTFSGTPAEGDSILACLIVTNAPTLTIPSCKRAGGANSAITSVVMTNGIHLLKWSYLNATWVLADTVGFDIADLAANATPATTDIVETENPTTGLHGKSTVAQVVTQGLPQAISTSSNPQFATIELGHASDTTLTRVSAGVIAVEGKTILASADTPSNGQVPMYNTDGTTTWEDLTEYDPIVAVQTVGFSITRGTTPKTLTVTGDATISGTPVSDTAYDATSWDAVTTVAPSKNAVRDQLEAFAPSGVAAIAHGGTAQTTAYASFDALTVHGANVASATTTNLDTSTGSYVHITGTTTITAITLTDGRARYVVFDGILTLTHGASLILPAGGSNITTAAGDRAVLRGEAAGVVRCVSYQRADGTPLVQTSQISDTAYDASSWDGVTTVAPSKNAVRDKFATLGTASTHAEGDFLTKATRTVTFSLTIDALADSMNYGLGFVGAAFTISEIRAVHVGAALSSPSILLKVYHGTDRSSGTAAVTAGTTVTSSTSGGSVTSFDSAACSANSWLWITTGSKSGTTDKLEIVVRGTYD